MQASCSMAPREEEKEPIRVLIGSRYLPGRGGWQASRQSLPPSLLPLLGVTLTAFFFSFNSSFNRRVCLGGTQVWGSRTAHAPGTSPTAAAAQATHCMGLSSRRSLQRSMYSHHPLRRWAIGWELQPGHWLGAPTPSAGPVPLTLIPCPNP